MRAPCTLALLLLAVPVAHAWDGERCVDALAVEAPPEVAAELAAQLRAGPLGRVEAGPCTGASAVVRAQAGRLDVHLDRAGATVDRSVPDVATAAAWLESWLVPASAGRAADTPVEAAPAGADAEVAVPASVDEVPSERELAVEPSSSSPWWQLALGASAAADGGGGIWAGPELGVDLAVGDRLMLGAALDVLWDASHEQGIDRMGYHASARVGVDLLQLGSVHIRLGLGVGVASGTVSQPSPDGAVADDAGGPFGDAFAGVVVPIGGPLDVLAVLYGRGHLVSQGVDDGDPADALPDALPRWMAGLRLGIGWSPGGAS